MYVHLKEIGHSKKVKYIETLRLLGHEPIPMKIIEEIENEKEAYELEYEIINLSYFKYRHPLVNRVGVDLRPPVRKGKKMPKESISKRLATMEEKRKNGYKKPNMTGEQKKKISKALKGKEGPNKVYVDLDFLRSLYIEQNKTKSEVMSVLNIGLGSLNRILSENGIRKL